MMSKLWKFITPVERRLLLFAILYGFLSIPVFIITKQFLHIFFAWNMILAVIPLLVTLLLRNKTIKHKWMKWIIVVIWLVMLPNAFYIITDFIHLTNYPFYTFEHPYAPMEYVRQIEAYVALIHIFLGALIGLFLACKSIDNALTFLCETFPKWKHHMILDISLLSSIGIYIGRFLRFNSWDVFRPINLITNVITSLDIFAFYFIILLVITHILLICLVMPFLRDTKKD